MKYEGKMDKRKRILHANLNNQGGAFSVAYEAQKELQKEYIFDYYSPDDFIKNDVYEHLLEMGSKCIGKVSTNNRFFKQFKVYTEFYNYLCSNKYDIVHIHSDTAWKMSVYYLAAKKAKVKRIIVHSHSSGIAGHHRFINYILHLIAKAVIKKAKYKCACSINAAKWMYSTTKNVRIIHNGIDIEKYKFNESKRKDIRGKNGLDGKIVIGSVSDYSYPKNPEFIYKLVKEFQDNKYAFLFVGDRKDECKLRTMIQKDRSIKNVTFVGTVTNVQDYLSAMDVFILPSRFEGLPMSALEAQVNGVYTLVSDKVTEDTKVSILFNRLKLDVDIWIDGIKALDLKYMRNKTGDYLEERVGSLNMARIIKQLYVIK